MVEVSLVKGEKIENMTIIGVDEVGRGCLAGPLVVGAVIIEPGIIEGVFDSKQVSAAKREELAPQIKEQAAGYGIGWVWPNEIDEIGLTRATKLGIKRAVRQIGMSYDLLITDGNTNFWPENKKIQAIVNADEKIYEVSAASIIAKVARDEYMKKLAKRYPNYGFEEHVGYSTGTHRKALKEHGVITGLYRVKNVKPLAEMVRLQAEKAAASLEQPGSPEQLAA